MSILVTSIVTGLGAAAGMAGGISFSLPKTRIAACALFGAATLGTLSMCGEAFKQANDYVKDYSETSSAANKAKLCVNDAPKGSTVTFIKSADGKITCDYTLK